MFVPRIPSCSCNITRPPLWQRKMVDRRSFYYSNSYFWRRTRELSDTTGLRTPCRTHSVLLYCRRYLFKMWSFGRHYITRTVRSGMVRIAALYFPCSLCLDKSDDCHSHSIIAAYDYNHTPPTGKLMAHFRHI